MRKSLKTNCILTLTLTIILLLMSCTTVNSEGYIPEGEGTMENPYLTYSVEDLKRIGNDEEWILDKHYKMMNDIILEKPNEKESNWTPIGTFDAPFTGTFNGNGKVIFGMVIRKIPHDNKYIGLFSAISGETAKIERLGLENMNICLDLDTAVSAITGALVGINIGGTIKDCYSEGIITGGRNYTGGLIGALVGSTVEGCYSKADIKDIGKKTVESAVGGLIGITVTINNGTPVIINRCYATGNIYGTAYAGGLVGLAAGTTIIENCYAIGNITSQMALGGLVGTSSRLIKNCYFSGNLMGERNITYKALDLPIAGEAGGIQSYLGVDDVTKNCVVLSRKIQSYGRTIGYLFTAEQVVEEAKIENNYILDDIEIIPLNDYKNEYLKSYISEKNK